MRKEDRDLFTRFLPRSIAFGLGFCLSLGLCGQAFAQGTDGGPNAAELEKLETKMFSRQYPTDPPEKRVERLELLVFGATQAGDMDERWARISKAAKDRQNPESTVVQPKNIESPAASASPSAAPPKGNYPAVDALEGRILKKTFRTEPISTGRTRLETKIAWSSKSEHAALFGRVERLEENRRYRCCRQPSI